MKIETKYKIGDEVYVISEGMLVTRKISEIKINVGSHYTKIVYGWIGATTYYFDEEACWPTVDEFVEKSLEGASEKKHYGES